MPHLQKRKKKKSLTVLIRILYMIGPSIVRVSKGRFDAFMGCSTDIASQCFLPTIPIVLDCAMWPVQQAANSIKAALDGTWPLLGCFLQGAGDTAAWLAGTSLFKQIGLGWCLRKVTFVIQVVVAKMTKVTFLSEISDEHFVDIDNSWKCRILWKCFTSVINRGGKSVQCEVSDECFILFWLTSLILKKAHYGLMGLARLDVISATYEYLC